MEVIDYLSMLRSIAAGRIVGCVRQSILLINLLLDLANVKSNFFLKHLVSGSDDPVSPLSSFIEKLADALDDSLLLFCQSILQIISEPPLRKS